jgi:hypothetical protein
MSAATQTPAPVASLEISLRIGQRVRHHDFHGKRVTGVVRGLSVEEDVLHADIALDAAIVIPARNADDRELQIWRQHVPAHELAPFDERDELIENLVQSLREALLQWNTQFEGEQDNDPWCIAARAAVANAAGGAA